MKKRILCFGDSNTHGVNPQDLSRYNEDIRFTGLLQQKLGPEYTVIEEGLLGRTTCLDDPELVGTNGLAYLIPCLGSHAPLDTLVIMLGTNDSRSVNGIDSPQIAANMEKVLKTALALPVWAKDPDILLLAPHPITPDYESGPLYQVMGPGCVEKTLPLAQSYGKIAESLGIRFLDAGAIVTVSPADGIHFTPEGHAALADALYKLLS